MIEPNNGALSEREQEILRLVATGASNKEIAQQLAISPNTVKVHLRNIFAKIGVASRTEATLFAIQHGYVQVGAATTAPVRPEADADDEAEPPETRPATPVAPVRAWPWRILGVSAVLAGLLLGAVWLLRPTAPVVTPEPQPTLTRWGAQASLPAGRSGLAVAVYEERLYAIGGETEAGVTGLSSRYDPQANTWTEAMSKPLAVADVSAAVIGGLIYVPGGRQADGTPAAELEVYDPEQDVWSRRAALPAPRSAYAAAAYEGRLYVFGGWDGRAFVDTVFEYDPEQDRWTERAAMPTARGFAGAAVASGALYVIGGTDGQRSLTANERFAPNAAVPWQARAPLPEERAQVGVVAIADVVHVVGEQPTAPHPYALSYFPEADEWHTIDLPFSEPWSQPGVAALGTRLFVLGGRTPAGITDQHWSYQAIYTLLIPVADGPGE